MLRVLERGSPQRPPRERMRTRLAATMFIVVLTAPSPAMSEGRPVAPGNATEKGFEPSSACSCHGELLPQWRASMHAKAISDPVFLVALEEAGRDGGEEVALFCKRCHAPVGHMLGDFDATGDVAKEGVTCMFCHQVTGMLKGEVGNVSQLVDADLVRRAQLKEPKAPHPAQYSSLHESPALCGGCHNVSHPGNGSHLESTYTEWEKGPYADEGIACQDCHMSVKPGVVGPARGVAADGAPSRDNIYSMRFFGPNLPQDDEGLATALLESAAKLELDTQGVLPAGQVASMTVAVTNSGAGHYLPTGVTDVRQMWLSVWTELPDGSKHSVAESRFGTVLEGTTDGGASSPWESLEVKSDFRIPPREMITLNYLYEVPVEVGSYTLKAALLYKSVPDELADKAGLTRNPTCRMTEVSRVVYQSETARTEAVEKPLGQRRLGAGVLRVPGWLALSVLAALALAAGVLNIYAIKAWRRSG